LASVFEREIGIRADNYLSFYFEMFYI